MRGWKLFKPEAAFAVRCPTCNAGPLQLCEGTDGRRPHRQRRIALFDERRGKTMANDGTARLDSRSDET
jgi:hypothetical protein